MKFLPGPKILNPLAVKLANWLSKDAKFRVTTE